MKIKCKIKCFIPSPVIFVHLCFLLSTSSSVCGLLSLPLLGFILYYVNKNTLKLPWFFGAGAQNNTDCRSFSHGIRSFPTVIPSHGINPTDFFCRVCSIPIFPTFYIQEFDVAPLSLSLSLFSLSLSLSLTHTHTQAFNFLTKSLQS